MSLWKIAWRSIEQRSLASTLTAISMALGVALVVAVLVAQGVLADSFKRGAGGYHLVVGKKGSQLQLVLNTVYHLSDVIENIPYSYYKEFTTDGDHVGRFASQVEVAIPYCLGDNYEGFRVVGTTPDLFEKLEYAGGKKYEFQSGGRNFEADHFYEAVIGSTVAKKTGLKVGSEFQPTHGLAAGEDGHKHDPFKIVGILKPTGTANDRALFINIEGFYLLDNHAKPLDDDESAAASHAATHPATHDEHATHAEKHHDEHAAHASEHPADADHDQHDAAAHKDEHAEHHEEHPEHAADADKHPADHDEHDAHAHEEHDHDAHAATAHDEHAHAEHAHDDHGHDDHAHDGHHHHEPLPEAQREVTSILVRAKGDLVAASLLKAINKGVVAQAASPVKVISDFIQSMVYHVTLALLGLTVMVVVVAGIGIMVSIYNSMNDRRRDIAVMRALGAGRETVLTVILLESILLSLGGGLIGWLLGHVLIGALGGVIEATSGVGIGFFQFVPLEMYLIPGLIALAAAVGYLPALSAYRTDVGKALSASP